MKNLTAAIWLTIAVLLGSAGVSWTVIKEKKIKIRRGALFPLILIYVTGVAIAGPASKDYSATEVMVLNDSALMYRTKNYFVTQTTGPVGKKGIPQRIKKGDRITVNDTTITVNHIRVTNILEDMFYAGRTFARKGDITCTLVESRSDFPNDEIKSRIWIHAKQCRPLR